MILKEGEVLARFKFNDDIGIEFSFIEFESGVFIVRRKTTIGFLYALERDGRSYVAWVTLKRVVESYNEGL